MMVWLTGGFSICVVSVLRLVIVHDAAEKGNVTSKLDVSLFEAAAEFLRRIGHSCSYLVDCGG